MDSMSAAAARSQQLILTLDVRRQVSEKHLDTLLASGLFASVILYNSQRDDLVLQSRCEQLIATIQRSDVAAIVGGDPRIATRTKADGVHFEGSVDDFKELIEVRDKNVILGFGNPKDRHTAMEAGELEPDYIFFGKLGSDNKDVAHKRNISLASWWSDVMEIAAIVQAGRAIESLDQCAATGSEFVAVEALLFDDNSDGDLSRLQHMKSRLGRL